MTDTIINTAVLGLRASLEQLQRVGENLANFSAGSDLVQDIVDLKSAERSFEANAAVIRSAHKIAQHTIDILIR